LGIAGTAGVELLLLAILVDATTAPATLREFIRRYRVITLAGSLRTGCLNLPGNHSRVRNIKRHIDFLIDIRFLDISHKTQTKQGLRRYINDSLLSQSWRNDPASQLIVMHITMINKHG
jgi:hypothetical protein